jgi:hypothetical protein
MLTEMELRENGKKGLGDSEHRLSYEEFCWKMKLRNGQRWRWIWGQKKCLKDG